MVTRLTAAEPRALATQCPDFILLFKAQLNAICFYVLAVHMLRGVSVNDYYANATKLKTISSLILTSMGTIHYGF